MMSSVIPPTRRGVKEIEMVCESPVPCLLCLSVWTQREFGLHDPAAVWGTKVPPQTQEIPAFLPQSTVAGVRLCMYFCGPEPVYVCQILMGFSGVYSIAGPTGHSPKGRTREKLNKHKHGLFLRTLLDTPIGQALWDPTLSLVHPPSPTLPP